MTNLSVGSNPVQTSRPKRTSPRYWSCRECGSQHLGDAPCPRCASDRRLAEAVASVKALDDDDAVLAAADAIEDMLYELSEQRWVADRNSRRASLVPEVRVSRIAVDA